MKQTVQFLKFVLKCPELYQVSSSLVIGFGSCQNLPLPLIWSLAFTTHTSCDVHIYYISFRVSWHLFTSCAFKLQHCNWRDSDTVMKQSSSLLCKVYLGDWKWRVEYSTLVCFCLSDWFHGPKTWLHGFPRSSVSNTICVLVFISFFRFHFGYSLRAASKLACSLVNFFYVCYGFLVLIWFHF